MEVTLGGKRLGSGKQQNLELHNYYRSNHNLSTKRRTSAAPGVLYPILTDIGLNGDKWKINIGTLVRTIPTLGPLFGSFKLQIDGFKIPIRLYQGILHNNPINIGLKMNRVYLPTIQIPKGKQTNNSLTKYLGLSGNNTFSGKRYPAIFHLAYYDIFKNYYANKQEEKAYVITGSEETELDTTAEYYRTGTPFLKQYNPDFPNWNNGCFAICRADMFGEYETIESMFVSKVKYGFQTSDILNSKITFKVAQAPEDIPVDNSVLTHTFTMQQCLDNEMVTDLRDVIGNGDIYVFFDTVQVVNILNETLNTEILPEHGIGISITGYEENNAITLQSFPLENIDTMRERLLANNTLGVRYNLPAMAPYDINTLAPKNLSGLVVKTYQSDLFNNWVNTEWLEGENGVNQISAAAIVDGKLTMDTLNLSQKVYNMLNRIAVSGGTYQDWQEAVYSQKAVRHAETPIYIGGLSAEIAFDEVVATSQADTQALGELGGRGSQNNVEGGQLEIDIDEPSIIMFLLSITPRINYTQGNKWYFGLDSLDDLHKPELDGIGFQDLIQEQMAWQTTTGNSEQSIVKKSAGKVPAWINYMTNYDECFGDFAGEEGYAYMVLNRNYNVVDNEIQDLTTYIDPSKYNYAFAYQGIDAQNFWVQVKFDIETRRVMSEKIIPNL